MLAFDPVQTDQQLGSGPLQCPLRSVAAELCGAPHRPTCRVHIQHFTDPLSAWCWATEPTLLHLSELLGGYVSIEHRMIGLMESVEPDDSASSDDALNRPSQLTMHWEEVGYLSGMPMDSDFWLERPIASSWPACAAVKAAQSQDPRRASHYLRRLREAALCNGEDLADTRILEKHANLVGLDASRLGSDLENGTAGAAFNEDMRLAAETGAIAPPSFFFFGPAGLAEIRGARTIEDMLSAVERVAGEPVPLCASPRSVANRHGYVKALASSRGSIAAAEIVELFEVERTVASDLLDRMAAGGSLRRAKAGSSSLYLPLSRS